MLMRTSSSAMPSGESTKSTQPAVCAAFGMPSYCALSSWAKVMPPSDLSSSMPSTPSLPVPDSRTPTPQLPWNSARLLKNASTGRCSRRMALRGCNCRRLRSITIERPGGFT